MKIYIAGAGCGGWPLVRMASFVGRVICSYVGCRTKGKQREIADLREFNQQRKSVKDEPVDPGDVTQRHPPPFVKARKHLDG